MEKQEKLMDTCNNPMFNIGEFVKFKNENDGSYHKITDNGYTVNGHKFIYRLSGGRWAYERELEEFIPAAKFGVGDIVKIFVDDQYECLDTICSWEFDKLCGEIFYDTAGGGTYPESELVLYDHPKNDVQKASKNDEIKVGARVKIINPESNYYDTIHTVVEYFKSNGTYCLDNDYAYPPNWLSTNLSDVNTDGFHPFDEVLARSNKYDKWMPYHFACIEKAGNGIMYRMTTGQVYPECVKYMGNENLLNI